MYSTKNLLGKDCIRDRKKQQFAPALLTTIYKQKVVYTSAVRQQIFPAVWQLLAHRLRDALTNVQWAEGYNVSRSFCRRCPT